ncbi:DUF5615 family PIN-like protein [Candidatus Gottesmanbacteria bacterium]|nr:DUF5615 family PIN-like protein [Candidatus Gottesmanbacteria bacterium]
MKFLIDESVEFSVVSFLRSTGHDIIAIAEDFPSLQDADVLRFAVKERRILITNDKDFGELIFLHRLPHKGVIFFRLSKEDAGSKIEKLKLLLQTYAKKLPRFFIVVAPDKIRIRT